MFEVVHTNLKMAIPHELCIENLTNLSYQQDEQVMQETTFYETPASLADKHQPIEVDVNIQTSQMSPMTGSDCQVTGSDFSEEDRALSECDLRSLYTGSSCEESRPLTEDCNEDYIEDVGDEINPHDLHYGIIHTEVDDSGARRIVWETHHVSLERREWFGFGIAVSGGTGNNHFESGEESIAIKDVLKGGPAEGKLKSNDRILSINGICMDESTLPDVTTLLRDSGNMVDLLIKRKVVMSKDGRRSVAMQRDHRTQDYGVILGCQYFIKSIKNGTPASHDGTLKEGDRVIKINNTYTDSVTLEKLQKIIDGTNKLKLVVSHGSDTLSELPNMYKSEESVLNWTKRLSNSSGYNSPSSDSPYMMSRSRSGSRVECSQMREVTFCKEKGSHGLTIVGGNATGVFISRVQQHSAAHNEAVREGDQILQISGISVQNQTREEVINRLRSLPYRVDLTLGDGFEEYIKLFKNSTKQDGDSFYVRSTCDNKTDLSYPHLSVKSGDILHVIDTIPDGISGEWRVIKIDQFGSEIEEGFVPSLNTLARLTSKLNLRIGKTAVILGSPECWQRITADERLQKIKPGYQRVEMKEADFKRPVIIYGEMTDCLYSKLPVKYSGDIDFLHKTYKKNTNTTISLSEIECIINNNRHCLLNIPPHITEKLILAGLSPIVMFIQFEKDDSVELDKQTEKHRSFMTTLKHVTSHFTQHTITLPQSSVDNSVWISRIYNKIKQEQSSQCWCTEDNTQRRGTGSGFVGQVSQTGSQMDLRNIGRSQYDGSLYNLPGVVNSRIRHAQSMNLVSPAGQTSWSRPRSTSQPKHPTRRSSINSLSSTSNRLSTGSPIRTPPCIRQGYKFQPIIPSSLNFHDNQAYEEDEDIYAAMRFTNGGSNTVQDKKTTGVWCTDTSKDIKNRSRSLNTNETTLHSRSSRTGERVKSQLTRPYSSSLCSTPRNKRRFTTNNNSTLLHSRLMGRRCSDGMLN